MEHDMWMWMKKEGNGNQESGIIKDIVDDTRELCEALVLGDARATPRERRVGICQVGSTGTATTAARKNHLRRSLGIFRCTTGRVPP